MDKHKKKKLQKIKDKYGEQDEEEREMRLKLLGARKAQGVDYEKLDKFGKKEMDVEQDE